MRGEGSAVGRAVLTQADSDLSACQHTEPEADAVLVKVGDSQREVREPGEGRRALFVAPALPAAAADG